MSSIGSTGAGSNCYSSAAARSQAVDRLFQKVDSNRDGQITKNELTQALESDSVKLGSSDQKSNVDEIFKLLDAGNKGYITKQDAADGLNQIQPPPPGGATAPANGGGPSKGASRPSGGEGGGPATTSAVSDPADTNQDGKVSMQEELAYIQKQYTTSDSMEPSKSVTYA